MIENRGTKSHFKMYKANKRWVFAGISVVMFSSVMMYGSITANAKETTPDTETPALTINQAEDDSISTHEIRIYTSARDGYEGTSAAVYMYAEQLKALAIDNYQAQTNQFIQTAKNLLATYQAAMADSVWANNSTNTLVETLTNLITDTQAKADEGLQQFQRASASDDFLNLVYSGSAELPNSISAIWESMNGTIDLFGQSTSYMMNAVLPSLDLNLVKPDNVTIIFSNEFVQAHPLIFDAATALANSITQLANQFFNVTEDLQAMIQPMVRISGYFDVSAPSVPQQVPSVELPTAPQQVVLKDIATQPQPREITIIPVDLGGNPLENTSSYQITAVPGVEIETPNTVNNYVPVNEKFTPTPGINYVAYKPINNFGNEGDGIQVKTQLGEGTSTTTEDITLVPVDLSGQPLYGHGPITIQGIPGYPVDTPAIDNYTALETTITPTYGENKVTYIPVNNPNVGNGVQVKTAVAEPTTPQERTITIIPVDLSGNPLEFAPSFTITAVPGVTIDTPTVSGYTPQNAKLTPTPGENKVVYIPVNYAGNEGDGIQVKTAVSEGVYHEAKTADPMIVPKESKAVETVTDLVNNQPRTNQSKVETTNHSGKSLPQTGESSQSELATIGLMLLGFMGLATVGKKKRY